jgi:hypothetical protein
MHKRTLIALPVIAAALNNEHIHIATDSAGARRDTDRIDPNLAIVFQFQCTTAAKI